MTETFEPGVEKTELELLKEKADIMGIKYHAAIGLVKLKAKVNEVLTDEPKEEKAEVVNAPTVAETLAAKRQRLRKAANALKRVRLTCMNPNKKKWKGEFFSVSNRYIGTIKKFIPFEAPDGWHIPVVLLDMIRDREFLTFYTEKVNGQDVKRTKTVREFAIETLPRLTKAELQALAKVQAVNRTAE